MQCANVACCHPKPKAGNLNCNKGVRGASQGSVSCCYDGLKAAVQLFDSRYKNIGTESAPLAVALIDACCLLGFTSTPVEAEKFLLDNFKSKDRISSKVTMSSQIQAVIRLGCLQMKIPVLPLKPDSFLRTYQLKNPNYLSNHSLEAALRSGIKKVHPEFEMAGNGIDVEIIGKTTQVQERLGNATPDDTRLDPSFSLIVMLLRWARKPRFHFYDDAYACNNSVAKEIGVDILEYLRLRAWRVKANNTRIKGFRVHYRRLHEVLQQRNRNVPAWKYERMNEVYKRLFCMLEDDDKGDLVKKGWDAGRSNTDENYLKKYSRKFLHLHSFAAWCTRINRYAYHFQLAQSLIVGIFSPHYSCEQKKNPKFSERLMHKIFYDCALRLLFVIGMFNFALLFQNKESVMEKTNKDRISKWINNTECIDIRDEVQDLVKDIDEEQYRHSLQQQIIAKSHGSNSVLVKDLESVEDDVTDNFLVVRVGILELYDRFDRQKKRLKISDVEKAASIETSTDDSKHANFPDAKSTVVTTQAPSEDSILLSDTKRRMKSNQSKKIADEEDEELESDDEEMESDDNCVSASNNTTTTNNTATTESTLDCADSPVPKFWVPGVVRLASKKDYGSLRLNLALRLKQKWIINQQAPEEFYYALKLKDTEHLVEVEDVLQDAQCETQHAIPNHVTKQIIPDTLSSHIEDPLSVLRPESQLFKNAFKDSIKNTGS